MGDNISFKAKINKLKMNLKKEKLMKHEVIGSINKDKNRVINACSNYLWSVDALANLQKHPIGSRTLKCTSVAETP